MIQRHLIKSPMLSGQRLLNEFDFFNDFDDTRRFLEECSKEGATRHIAMVMLQRLDEARKHTNRSKSQAKWSEWGRKTVGLFSMEDVPVWHFNNTRAMMKNGSSIRLHSSHGNYLHKRIQFSPRSSRSAPFLYFKAGTHESSHETLGHAKAAVLTRAYDRWSEWGDAS
jgi:hypothetical protein